MAGSTVKLNDLIEKASFLSFEEQEIMLDILRRRYIEKRREQIAANARKTLQEYKAGRARRGSARDLKKDLLEND
jgi:hypothetical protein